MSRTGFIEHQERQIVLMNFAGIQTSEEALVAIEEAPPSSVPDIAR